MNCFDISKKEFVPIDVPGDKPDPCMKVQMHLWEKKTRITEGKKERTELQHVIVVYSRKVRAGM